MQAPLHCPLTSVTPSASKTLSMHACRLIVHADDFGLSAAVNAGIVRAHREGILTSTSIIAAGRAIDDACARLHSAPMLDIGVHLTLVGERSMAAHDLIPTLLDDTGLLLPDAATFIKRYLAGGIALHEVRSELDAQIRSVLSRGIKVTHLDGHQHLHMLPGIRRVVGALAREYAIPAIRYPHEALKTYMLREPGGLPRLLQLLALNTACAAADVTDARRPDRFFGFFYGGRLTKPNLMTVLQHLPTGGTCELMCHPGDADAAAHHAHWNYCWQDERDALIDADVRTYLQQRGVQLISYANLDS